MKIEALYPELCNLYGDAMNAEYLHRAVPEAELIKTTLKEKPAFTSGDPDMIYMGSMTESGQSIAAEALLPYRDRIMDMIGGGTVFLITGNALELFGTRIENEDGSYIETLGIFELYAKRQMMRRYNSIYLGAFGKIEIVGFKSQFSHSYGNSIPIPPLFHTSRGAGQKPGQQEEGVRLNNFLATYVLGPLLILNPPFTHYLLGLLNAGGRELPYEREAMAAYEARLREFHDPKTGEEY